jgi:(heptosyl)LPS beta-1,4-glucosyltransferase
VNSSTSAGAQPLRLPPRWLDLTSAAIVFLTLSLGLVLPKIAGGGFLLLALIAIVWLSIAGAWGFRGLAPLERLSIFGVILFVAVWALAWLIHGASPEGADDLGRIARLLLIIPLLLFVRRLDRTEPAWWAGLAVGALIAGGYAWWFHLSGQIGPFDQRVTGNTNPIYFGSIALAFGMMMLARLQDDDLPIPARLLTALAILLALSASMLSGSRGAWLVLPPLLLVYLFTLGRYRPLRWRLGVPAAAVVVVALVMFNPLAPMSERAAEGLADLRAIATGGEAEGTIGRRVAMWELSGQLVLDDPLFGAGPTAFADAMADAIDQGRLPADFDRYTHPHNEFLSALNHGGIVALVCLLLLFTLITRQHVRVWRTGLKSTRLIGWAGLAGMAVIVVMALSESIFDRNSGVIWFGLFAALPIGMIHSARRRTLDQPVTRRHSLSVIVICKDEADRIGRCLGSVAGWADEIIVLDSGSRDDTVAISRRFTDRVEETDWPGYGVQKQRALDRARGDWVLSMDADEYLSDDLRKEIDQVLAQPQPEHQAYTLSWLTHAFGQALHFGHWSRTPLRLFRRDLARFTPAKVHEKVVMPKTARLGLLESPLHHHVFRGVDHARAKLRRYAELQAAERHARGRRVRFALTPWLRALFNLLDNYFLRMALLDGRGGVRMTLLHARYTFDKYALLRELSRKDQSG